MQSRYKRDLKRDLNRYRLNLYLSALDTSLTKFAESLDKNYLDFYGRLNPAIRNRNSVNIRLTILAKLVDVHLGREKHSFDSFEQRFNRLISESIYTKQPQIRLKQRSRTVISQTSQLQCLNHSSDLDVPGTNPFKGFRVALAIKSPPEKEQS